MGSTRILEVKKAENELAEYIDRVRTKYNLTFSEMVRILGLNITSLSEYGAEAEGRNSQYGVKTGNSWEN